MNQYDADDTEEMAELIHELLTDEETEACTFAFTNGDVTGSYTVTGGDDANHVDMVAHQLLEHTARSDKSSKKFLRAVVNQYNNRKDKFAQERL